MILVDLLTGVGPGVVVGVACVAVAGPGDSGGAATGAGVSGNVAGSLGVVGDPTGVEKGVGGGEVVSVAVYFVGLSECGSLDWPDSG